MFGHCGAAEALLPPHWQRCLQEAHSDQEAGNASGFHHTQMGFGTMGPGLLRADEEIWKGF